jgi:hypothetical protein
LRLAVCNCCDCGYDEGELALSHLVHFKSALENLAVDPASAWPACVGALPLR